MTQHVYRRWCSVALLILTLISLICFWSISRTGLQIDTNLRSLSPSFSVDALVNQALNKMSADAAQQFMLVLVHEDEDALTDASDYLRELIEQDAQVIRYIDHTALLDAYAAQLQQHSFHILGPQAQASLAQGSAESILKLGENNLYGSGGVLRLVPITRDPLGFANEYALGLLDRIGVNGGDEIQAVRRAGKEVFIAPHQLRLASDAMEMKQQDQALAELEKIIAQFKAEYPDVEIVESGILFFAADSAQSARADIETISTGSTIGVLLLALWIFRGPRALVLPALSIGMGLAFAFSICHYWLGSIHVLTLVFGSSLIGVVVDYALHYFYFQAHHPQGENRLPLYRALMLSLLTSVIGFSALAWSGLAALQQVAVFAALGLVYAWLVVISLGHFLTKNVKVYDAGLQKAVLGVLRLFGKLRAVHVILAILIVLGASFLVNRFDFPVSDNPRSFFAANPQLIEQEKQVSEWVASHEPASFILVHGKSAQQVYDRIALVQAAVDNISQDDEASLPLLGVHQFFPAPAQQQANYQFNKRLYDAGGLAERFIQQQGLSEISTEALTAAYQSQRQDLLNPAEFFTGHAFLLPPLWVESEKGIDAFLMLPKSMDVHEIADRVTVIPGVSFFSAMQDAEMGMKKLRQSSMKLLLLALALMAALLLIRYPWRKVLQLMAVPAFAISASFILLALFNVPLTLFHVMALFLVVGLGMDYVIFIAEMSENSVETLSAVAISSTTNLLSFGLLGLSVLPAVSAFGLALFIGSSFNLLGALLLASRRWANNQCDTGVEAPVNK